MRKFKVAAVQLNLGQSTPKIVADIKRYVKLAKKKGVKIICFPEDSIFAGPKKNETILQEIKKTCFEAKIWSIVVGHFHDKNKKCYNSAWLINEQGEIQGKHNKVHICDAPHVCAGECFSVYQTPFCKIGIAICWDVAYPDALASMAQQGAELIFCPMYWCYEEWAHRKNHLQQEKKILQSLVLTRAFENMTYVVFCNPYEKNEHHLTSYTAIAEPHKIIGELFMFR